MFTISTPKTRLLREVGAFLHYLHLDLALTGLLLAIAMGAGLANNLDGIRSFAADFSQLRQSNDASVRDETATSPATLLTPAMRAALDDVVQRYRVSPEALLPVFEAIQSVARERKLDPLLLVAVIAIESRFNPFSQSPMGAQGLMQVIPRYHQDKVPAAAAEQPFLDPVSNVRIGAQVLQQAIGRQGGLVDGLQSYAGALDDDERSYANKVLAERQRLDQALRRVAPPNPRD